MTLLLLGIDLESCSAADINDGAWAYSEHPSTRVWCLVAILAEVTRGSVRPLQRVRWLRGQPVPRWVLEHRGRWVAHNAAMEDSMLRHCDDLREWPKVAPEDWVDSMHIMAQAGLPLSLEAGCAVFPGLPGKDMEGHALMLRLAKAKEESPGRWAYPSPSEEQLQRLTDYCEKDVECSLALLSLAPMPSVDEVATMRWDTMVNVRGVPVDLELARAIGYIAEQRAEELSCEAWEASQDVLRLSNVPSLQRWLESRGVEVPRVKRKGGKESPSLDVAAVQSLLARPDLPTDVAAVLRARAESGKLTSLAKVARVQLAVGKDEKLHNSLRYHKAHTGRWSSEVVQVHNLPKATKAFKAKASEIQLAIRRRDYPAVKSLWPNVLEACSQSLRALFVPPKGHLFIGGDFAAVEARVLAWLAGERATLQRFVKGEDVYTADAAAVGSGDRQFGKLLRLGLGYGMGAAQFVRHAKKNGLTILPRDAKQAVLGWREDNQRIVAWWGELFEAMVAAAEEQQTTWLSEGCICVRPGPAHVQLVLPGGRALRYWRPRVRTRMREMEIVNAQGELELVEREIKELAFWARKGRKMMVDGTYGGELAENVVQAVSRDLLRDSAMLLEDSGFPVALHVHDSIACAVPADEAHAKEAEFAQLMSTTRACYAGLPIAVETYVAACFKG